MEQQEAQEIVLMLTAYYENWHPSRETLELYESLLMPLEGRLAKAAVMRLIQTSEAAFVPKVGTICRMIAEASLEARNLSFGSPEEAWSEVWDKIGSCGYYRKPAFTNPAITRAVNALGWQELCTNPNVEASRAHFFRLYGAFRERTIHEEVLELTGGDHLAQLARETLELEHEPALKVAK